VMTVKTTVMQQAALSLILTPGSSLLSLIFNPEVKLETICSSEPHNLKTDDSTLPLELIFRRKK
jgi:hypothetical protein